jgi:hypothetical protein
MMKILTLTAALTLSLATLSACSKLETGESRATLTGGIQLATLYNGKGAHLAWYKSGYGSIEARLDGYKRASDPGYVDTVTSADFKKHIEEKTGCEINKTDKVRIVSGPKVGLYASYTNAGCSE